MEQVESAKLEIKTQEVTHSPTAKPNLARLVLIGFMLINKAQRQPRCKALTATMTLPVENTGPSRR